MKLPFDKCYCLHLTESSIRLDNINNTLNTIGIKDQVEIWWTTTRPWSTEIGDMITTLHSNAYDKIKNKVNKNLYGSVYNCSLEFYTMIKQAYLRGFETILVMEDDIQPIENFDYEHFFNNLPDDWDILRLGFSKCHNEWISKTDIYNNTNDIILKADWQFGGMCMVAFNRKAMKFYIDYMTEKFEYADAPLTYCFNNNNKKYLCDGKPLNVYIARQSIVNVDGMQSTIQTNVIK